MTITIKNIPTEAVSCANCQACCCHLEVMLISETGVPDRHIVQDEWGGESMLRLDDGWCSALDRDTLLCTIYENRPWGCRAFEVDSFECNTERSLHGVTPYSLA